MKRTKTKTRSKGSTKTEADSDANNREKLLFGLSPCQLCKKSLILRADAEMDPSGMALPIRRFRQPTGSTRQAARRGSPHTGSTCRPPRTAPGLGSTPCDSSWLHGRILTRIQPPILDPSRGAEHCSRARAAVPVWVGSAHQQPSATREAGPGGREGGSGTSFAYVLHGEIRSPEI
ncbi:unnamed protein product [Prorocentrum cordatum]|uniref:Uncharacterized protein n=2 Tax=Prorocentrum cordatum TaxID=2364126 RepID=A0ABN9RKR7_9DINO|nr:unnamed protein product [Polarella glacialis]